MKTRAAIGVGILLAMEGALALGCNDRFGVCHSGDECQDSSAGEGNAAGDSGISGMSSAGGSGGGGELAGSGGEPLPAAGGSDGGEAGSGGVAPQTGCGEGYTTWFSSSFSFPDGAALGTADIPSFPWVKSGNVFVAGERLTGAGTAVVGQGLTFPLEAARLRFRVRFSARAQQAAVAVNAATDGSGGVRLALHASGKITLTDGIQVVAQFNLPALDTDLDYFVEAQFHEPGTEIFVSTVDYGSEQRAVVDGQLSTGRWLPTSSGLKTSVTLTGAGESAPAVSELAYSRCGTEANGYEPVFVDTFQRPDSISLGAPDFPSGSAWTASSSEARIVGGALQLSQLASAQVLVKNLPVYGLRIRATVRMSGALWMNVNYNVSADLTEAVSSQGFWVWGPEDDAMYATIFLGETGSEKFAGSTFVESLRYFVQFDRDGGIGTLTVRSGSSSGPILSTQTDRLLMESDSTGEYLRVSSSTGGATLMTWIEELRVEHYGTN